MLTPHWIADFTHELGEPHGGYPGIAGIEASTGDHLTTFSGTYLESGKPFVYALSHAGIAPSPCVRSALARFAVAAGRD